MGLGDEVRCLLMELRLEIVKVARDVEKYCNGKLCGKLENIAVKNSCVLRSLGG